ncbi:MFS transporter [Methanoregula sp.]|uniref:MFS transporter n=1 Tax=Methanoregula sp. TaxID=2052170 RepID=UPI003566B357
MLLNEYEKPTKTHRTIFCLAWAGWVFDFYDLLLFSFLLIPIGAEFHLSSVSLALVMGASLLATAIGGIIFGALSDRFGRKSVLQWTILVYSLGTFATLFSTSLIWLLACRIVTGLGVGGEWAAGQTYIAETFPAKDRGRYGSLLQTGAPVGMILAALCGGLLSPIIGWRACFALSVLPALIVIAIRRYLPESDVWEEARAAGLGTQASRPGIRDLFSRNYRKIFCLALVLSIFGMSAYWFAYSWLPGYLVQQRNFSLAASAVWVIIVQAGAFAGYLSFGIVADRAGRRPAFTIYGIIMATGLALVTLGWDLIASSLALVLLSMLAVGFGTGFFGGFGPLYAELFPTPVRNLAMGSAFNIARGVQFFTPVIITLIGAAFGLAAGISVAAIFALLVALWIWTFPETKGRTIRDVDSQVSPD